jgi:hypothetical protein
MVGGHRNGGQIILTYNLVYDSWLISNKNEHDLNGNPGLQKREKLIKNMQGKAKRTKYEYYKTS